MTDTSEPPSDGSPLTPRGAITLSVGLLALPPLIPILAAFWPHLIPVPFVDNSHLAELRGVLVALGAVLFVVNMGLVYVLYRLLD
ncbi:MAG: hypothetical protein ABEL76_13470 [Bradymonadaceae bacterium]